MKRFLSLLMLPALLLGLNGCTFSNETYYHHAQLYLGNGEFAAAARMFNHLGEYEDSADYALYCAALDALMEGRLTVARANMTLLVPFKSSERYLQYITALELENEGKLEEALAAFTALGSFENSLDKAERLSEAIPEAELSHARALMGASRWEQALTLLEGLNGYGESNRLAEQCRQKIHRAAYDQALSLYNSEQYEEALSAFEALGETLDAPARARMCRGAMYAQLETEYTGACTATAQDLMNRYAEMEDYFASPQRLQALRDRFSVNLKLTAAAYARPYVLFGGSQQWRVIGTEGSHITLTAQEPSLFATITDLAPTLTPQEESAVVSWKHPLMTIDLDQYSFTQGSGTPADPFR